MRALFSAAALCMAFALISCESPRVSYGPANMGGPSMEMRNAQVAGEETGPFFIGRRYHVHRTWFWGYLRRPREPWSKATLVVFNQTRRRAPDNLSQAGPPGTRYAYDNNYQYRIWGQYPGELVYEPNSNQVLPEFLLTDYQLVDSNPGWLFHPGDHYDPHRLSLLP
jgi:hypothetical protein